MGTKCPGIRKRGGASTEENEKAIDKRKLILNEAVRLFYEKGYDNTSIRTLAEATGLSVAGIYYFFQDKEEILIEILKQSGEDLIESVSGSFDQTVAPDISLRRTVRDMLEHSVDHNKDLVILSREINRLSEDRQMVIQEAKRKAYDLVKLGFMRFCEQERMRKEDVVLASFTLLSEATWFARWYKPGGRLDLDHFSERITDMLLRGLIS